MTEQLWSPFVLDVDFAIEARELPAVPYATDVAVRTALATAPSRAIEGVLSVFAVQ